MTTAIHGLFLLLFAASAQAAPDCAPQALSQVYPAATAPELPVKVKISREGGNLVASFDVQSTEIHGKEALSTGEFPFHFDVVELFVSATGGLPYYEFEISAFNQAYEVRIDHPEKPFQPNPGVNAPHSVTKTATGWTARLEVPLERIAWKGDEKQIVGNAFAVLGKRPARRYYSRSLPVQAKPRFHLPEFFRPLLGCP